jgi:quercetin 2,3-dioxygenase
MIKIRKASERGHANHGWLDSWHSFSFANYHDPAHMGYRSLRVINDDRIAPGRGFGAHAHRDMEIITYVIEGKLAHKDSTGEDHVIGPNTIQAMSAGTGIVHSEFNASSDAPVHSLQIWIEPAMEDAVPSYQQISFEPSDKREKFKLIAGPHATEQHDSAVIHQDARVYVAELETDKTLPGLLNPGRYGWVQVAAGTVAVNGEELHEGDGAAIENETKLLFTGKSSRPAEFLLFDLP